MSGDPDGDARQALEHVARLKRTFGDIPTWGMVEMAYRTGWLAAATGWRYDSPA
jgi:hypothetical protein